MSYPRRTIWRHRLAIRKVKTNVGHTQQLQILMLIPEANKKFYDPRVWVREGEKTMSTRVKQALEDFNTAGQL